MCLEKRRVGSLARSLDLDIADGMNLIMGREIRFPDAILQMRFSGKENGSADDPSVILE
jgi:hypothetical protein